MAATQAPLLDIQDGSDIPKDDDENNAKREIDQFEIEPPSIQKPPEQSTLCSRFKRVLPLVLTVLLLTFVAAVAVRDDVSLASLTVIVVCLATAFFVVSCVFARSLSLGLVSLRSGEDLEAAFPKGFVCAAAAATVLAAVTMSTVKLLGREEILLTHGELNIWYLTSVLALSVIVKLLLLRRLARKLLTFSILLDFLSCILTLVLVVEDQEKVSLTPAILEKFRLYQLPSTFLKPVESFDEPFPDMTAVYLKVLQVAPIYFLFYLSLSLLVASLNSLFHMNNSSRSLAEPGCKSAIGAFGLVLVTSALVTDSALIVYPDIGDLHNDTLQGTRHAFVSIQYVVGFIAVSFFYNASGYRKGILLLLCLPLFALSVFTLTKTVSAQDDRQGLEERALSCFPDHPDEFCVYSNVSRNHDTPDENDWHSDTQCIPRSKFCDGVIDIFSLSTWTDGRFAICDAALQPDYTNTLSFPDETLCYSGWEPLYDVLDLVAVLGIVLSCLLFFELLRFAGEAWRDFKVLVALARREIRREQRGSNSDYDFSLFVNN